MVEKETFQSEKFYVLLIVAAAFLVTLPVLIWGVPYGYDMPHHYQCALTYLDALKSGDFYPSWTLARNLGYGALELRMYPPISHYVLALFEAVVGDWHLATWLTYLFWWTLGSLGVYLLSREFVKPNAAAFAAILFAAMPYRLSQLYLTFLYSELCAIAVLPFCFYFLTRVIKESNGENKTFEPLQKIFLSLDVLGLAVSYAVLILTHLPMTLIGTFSLGIYFFAQVRWNFKSLQCAALKTACSLSLGLVATSFFWTKVLQERFLMGKNDIYEEIYVYYQYNFLLTWLQKYDEISGNVAGNTVVYDVVLYLTLLTVLPIALLRVFSKTKTENHLWRGLWVALIASIFLTTVLSRPLWDNLPLLYEVQFSWRWLGVVSIFAPIVAAGGFSIFSDWFKDGKKRPFALIILGTILIGLSFSLSQSIRGAVYKSPTEINNNVEEAGQKEGFTFWWTIWARKEIFQVKDKISAGDRDVRIKTWTATEREFQIAPGEAANARIAVFHHPNWKATINDAPVEIEPDANGAVLIPLSSQAAEIKLLFRESAAVQIGRFASVFAWLGIFLFFIFNSRKQNSSNYNENNQ